jgi:hypothetical protein
MKKPPTVRTLHPGSWRFWGQLFLAEGLAIGALIHGGICFMGAYQDAFQRAVVCITTVVCALLDSTFNGLVCMAVHSHFLLFS